MLTVRWMYHRETVIAGPFSCLTCRHYSRPFEAAMFESREIETLVAARAVLREADGSRWRLFAHLKQSLRHLDAWIGLDRLHVLEAHFVGVSSLSVLSYHVAPPRSHRNGVPLLPHRSNARRAAVFGWGFAAVHCSQGCARAERQPWRLPESEARLAVRHQTWDRAQSGVFPDGPPASKASEGRGVWPPPGYPSSPCERARVRSRASETG